MRPSLSPEHQVGGKEHAPSRAHAPGVITALRKAGINKQTKTLKGNSHFAKKAWAVKRTFRSCPAYSEEIHLETHQSHPSVH